MLKRAELVKRLNRQTFKTETCWLWLGCTNGKYPTLTLEGRTRYAHRISWQVANGRKPPTGYDVHHRCENTICVRPSHLKILKRKQHSHISNGFGGINYRKTHCPKNHEYTPENTYLGTNGSRYCRECGCLAAAEKRKRNGTYRGRTYAITRRAMVA